MYKQVKRQEEKFSVVKFRALNNLGKADCKALRVFLSHQIKTKIPAWLLRCKLTDSQYNRLSKVMLN